MAVAFSEQEKEQIRAALKRTARRCASTLGVRKTTVDQLCQAADISKGGFYRFYESKELLFFELLEDLHTEIYQASALVLEEKRSLPAAKRLAEAVLVACRGIETSGMMDFMERDVPYLLRKIPKEIKEAHYHSDEVHIKELLNQAGLEPAGGLELAAAVVRGLILTVSHQDEIGAMYPQVLETLVRGACDRLFPTN